MRNASEVPRIFILSPARLDGIRAKPLFDPNNTSELAAALRTRAGVPIGEVFSHISSLYFRGKLAYSLRFARPVTGHVWLGRGAVVITANRGLLSVDAHICIEHLEAFAETEITEEQRNFRRPLERDAAELARQLGPTGEIILLGSVASKKYVEPLLGVFKDRLLFPADFVGRGDMSRGGLLLRAVAANSELTYVPVGTTRKGKRPPKLPRRER